MAGTWADLVTVKWRGGETGARVLVAQRNRLRPGMAQMLRRAGQVYVETLPQYTPVGENVPALRAKGRRPSRKGHKAGTLRDSWRMRYSGAGPDARVTVYSTAAYLRFVIKGRAAIDQRNKPASRRWPLLFHWRGAWVYRWSVGPVAPNPFHKKAVRAARRRVIREIGVEARGILARVNTEIGG